MIGPHLLGLGAGEGLGNQPNGSASATPSPIIGQPDAPWERPAESLDDVAASLLPSAQQFPQQVARSFGTQRHATAIYAISEANPYQRGFNPQFNPAQSPARPSPTPNPMAGPDGAPTNDASAHATDAGPDAGPDAEPDGGDGAECRTCSARNKWHRGRTSWTSSSRG